MVAKKVEFLSFLLATSEAYPNKSIPIDSWSHAIDINRNGHAFSCNDSKRR